MSSGQPCALWERAMVPGSGPAKLQLEPTTWRRAPTPDGADAERPKGRRSNLCLKGFISLWLCPAECCVVRCVLIESESDQMKLYLASLIRLLVSKGTLSQDELVAFVDIIDSEGKAGPGDS